MSQFAGEPVRRSSQADSAGPHGLTGSLAHAFHLMSLLAPPAPLVYATAMFGLGIGELLVILVIVLVIFGAGKLPEIGQGLGKGIRGFKREVTRPDEIDITPKPEDKPPGGDPPPQA